MPPLAQTFDRKDHIFPCPPGFRKILDDAIRFFSGTPVHALPPPIKFAGSGVYAIYCIATEGLYQKYGNEVNKYSYQVPIYVGKAVPQGWRPMQNASLCFLSINEQLDFWKSLVKKTVGLFADDFMVRFCSSNYVGLELCSQLYKSLNILFSPLWNELFPSCSTPSDFVSEWKRFHTIRFQTRADNPMAKILMNRIDQVTT